MKKQKPESYFEVHSKSFNLDHFFHSKQVRESQRGAIFALLGHFSVHLDPAIVAMPTGTGKSALIMLLPFLYKSKRTLIITSNRLVRSQITEDYQQLATLQRLNLLDTNTALPKIAEVSKLMKSESDWKALESFDVVVALPNSISPKTKNVIPSPHNFFDLVLVDEGHHASAETWHSILAQYSEAKQILFTATPFRRDLLSIPGKIVYAYPVSRAFKEGTMRAIHYLSVPQESEDESIQKLDIKIAKEVEKKFCADKKSGFAHRIIVRGDTQDRAKELYDLYVKETKLEMALIHSKVAYSNVKEIIGRLRCGDLDGVVCVDMLGEGFDLPELKIAGIHSPHKSLAVTLQFIGRFSRTSTGTIGDACFISAPSTVQIEGQRLYEEGLIWQKVIPDLADVALGKELLSREIFESFASSEPSDGQKDPALIRTIESFCHMKIYSPFFSPNMLEPVDSIMGERIVLKQPNALGNALVIVTEVEESPKWSNATELGTFKRQLYFLYYSQKRNFLFINSSQKSEAVYAKLLELFCKNGARVISPATAHQALHGLSDFNFFNLGVRGRQKGANVESYKIAAGKNVHLSLLPTDPSRFVQGHLQCTAREGARSTTIGYSVSGKIWEMQYLSIPNLILWCDKIAEKLILKEKVLTNTAVDKLPLGTTVDKFAQNVITATWNSHTFQNPVKLAKTNKSTGECSEVEFLLCEFTDFKLSASKSELAFALRLHGDLVKLNFRLNSNATYDFSIDPKSQFELVILTKSSNIALVDYLKEFPLSFYSFDFSLYSGALYYEAPVVASSEIPIEIFEIINWKGKGVDIRSEKSDTNKGMSIHKFIENNYSKAHNILYADDSSNEAADFIGFSQSGNKVKITLYHCKKSSKSNAGCRVEDVYEVSGQAIKCFEFTTNPKSIFQHVFERYKKKSGRAEFIAGKLEELESLYIAKQKNSFTFEIVIVQPGISFRLQHTGGVGKVLLGARELLQAGGATIKVLGSA